MVKRGASGREGVADEDGQGSERSHQHEARVCSCAEEGEDVPRKVTGEEGKEAPSGTWRRIRA